MFRNAERMHLIGHASSGTYRVRCLSVLLVLLIYVLLFPRLYSFLGNGAIPLGQVIGVMAGALLGLKGGVFFGFITSTAVSYLAIRYAGYPLSAIKTIGIPAAIVAILIDGGIGFCRDLILKLGFENRERKKLEKDLRRAKDEAQMANLTKSIFLANMSHEIRNPLNAIIGFLELDFEDASLPKFRKAHLMTTLNSANGLLELIKNILDFSKLELGSVVIEKHSFRLRGLMQEIYSAMETKTREKGIHLQFDIEPSVLDPCLGDPQKLKQIMYHLLNRAIKSTKKGHVSVRVMPAEKENQIHFMVQNTGGGIPADRLSRIFDPFVQEGGTTTHPFDGTGLGMNIARGLIELMGGRIWAESEEGAGSTFHFTAPLALTNRVSEKAYEGRT